MNTAKTLLNFVLAGALLGIAAASWIGPSFLGWYNETPYATQTMCNLPEVIRKTASDVLTYQAVGAGIGAFVMLVLGVLFVRRASRRARMQAGQTPPTAPPPAAPRATA
ncbi:hypothetical protein [Myxococcus sp. RHSTA-1-4]|uniref:hypothetical protein n=1 Tax=Myxococcus sp. RHSTA-1-4 TaxID=2874601 RepID=UPI001CC0CE6A|nr:hypothetical protein [Myxococcus sp. RHSTA-1-4]MBZ4420270.1 hypothetical protein [Myxococcus sp. RHSTA-1-4]